MTAMTRHGLAIALALGLQGWAGVASADTKTVEGSQLVLSATSSEDVTIRTAPGMVGRIRLTMTGSVDCLSTVGGHVAVVGTARCGEDDGRLWVDVPDDTPVTVSSTGSGDIQVGDLRGPLVVSLQASGNLVAGRAGTLVVSVRGSGDVEAGEVDGPFTLDSAGGGNVTVKHVHGTLVSKQAGSGDLAIGGIDADSAMLQAYGSGDAKIGSGRIGNLHARFSGSSDLTIEARVGDADVQANGGSDISLSEVTGTLTKRATGGSDITIGSEPKASANEEAARDNARRAEIAAATAMREAQREENGARRAEAMASADRAMADAKRQMSEISTSSDDEDSSANDTNTHRHEVHSYMLHVLTVLVVGIVLFISYRIIRRAGGVSGLRRRAGVPDAPTDPGVLALCETMTRLDQRLGRLEGYVTTREFDLNRKFRELGR